jgi:hypothetical protein
MKHISFFFLCLMPSLLLCSCAGNTYSKQIRQEKKLIDSYIAKNNLHIIYDAPKLAHGGKWDKNDYLAVADYDNFYFHLTSAIDTTAERLTSGMRVNVRYRKYGLDTYTDTVSCWNTDDLGEPVQFSLGIVDNNSCTAWHLAISRMGYSGAECRIICPSTIGFTQDNASVTPYIYEIKVTKRK